DRPLRFCCQTIAKWSSNSGVWGGVCGYTPSDSSELIGGRCTQRPSSGTCPGGTMATCCRGAVASPCYIGTQCASG
ncbi:hypothetical protein COCC4DRAFT_151861, partial [Bipolaris maydis ATCC 48331]